MNPSQLSVLDAMGISTWQLKEPGEIPSPELSQKPESQGSQVKYVVLVKGDELAENRRFFQSILAAVAWPLSSLRILSESSLLAELDSTFIQLIWAVGELEGNAGSWKNIQSPSLAELACNPRAKAELWLQLKEFRCV